MARDYAALPYEYLDEMSILSDAEFGRLCRSLIAYSRDGTPIESPCAGNERFFAVRVMRREDWIQASYKSKVERNRENGQNGGRPKNPKKPKITQNNPTKPNRTQKTQEEEKDKDKEEYKDEEDIFSPYGENIPPQSPPKGAKTKQPKVQWAEFVTMTNAEHDKLLAAYGPVDTQRLIEILDNYKGSSGKKYKNDYRAILSWVVGKLDEEKAKRPKNGADGRTDNIFLTMLAKEREKAEPPDNDWGDLP